MSMLKRQREQGKNERAARKRAKRHGYREVGFEEPTQTEGIAELLKLKPAGDEDSSIAPSGEARREAKP